MGIFKLSYRIIGLAILFISSASYAQMETWDKPDIKALTTELVMELKVMIGAPVSIGESDLGSRRFIPITGGSFEGKGIKGEVIPGGADWQLTRPDGVLEVKAIYAIKTDDGQVVAVDNRGLVAPIAADDEAGTPASRYVRTTPTFQAPKGKYEWLNQRVFTGTITPSRQGDFVTIRVFQIN